MKHPLTFRAHHLARWSHALCIAAFAAAVPGVVHSVTIGELVAVALARSPQLQAMTYSARSADERAATMSSWPDPLLSMNLMNVGFPKWNIGMMDMSQASVQITQELPIRGKVGIEYRMAQTDGRVAEAMRDDNGNTLAARVAMAALDLYELDRSVAIQTRVRDLYGEMVRAGESRFISGGMMQADVTMMRIELGMADASLRELQARRAALVAKVNGLLNRSSGTSIDSIFAAGLPSMPLDTAALAQQAINRHPMLARARVLQQQSQIMQELARANLVPSPMIMARYGNRGTKDGIYEIGVSVPIPLHLDQRQRGAIRATGEMERMRERETAGAEREIRAMVEETVARIQAARIMWESYQSDLLPQARQAVESSIAGYATGMSHFEQPLLAAQTLQRIEQETLNSELMVRRMLVELEASRGTAAEIAQGKSEFVR